MYKGVHHLSVLHLLQLRATMGVDRPPPTSFDDSILSYIRCMQCSSSKSSPEERQQYISKKQICNFFTIDYDTTTTEKDVKHALKRLVKRGVISKDDMGYSYIQPQISIDSISLDKGYHNQKVDVQSSDDVATRSRDRSRTTDIEPLSLDDNILSYIRDSCQSSSTASSVLQQQSITKKQIQKHYDSIVNEYETTKKNVKHVLKRLVKRNAIVKVGKKTYSCIQPHQRKDICTVIVDINRSQKRKRKPEENNDVSTSTTEPTTVKKRFKHKCTHEGCTKKVINGGVCIKHGAKRWVCSHEGCTNWIVNGRVCIKHGASHPRCSVEGCSNQVINGGVCLKHGAKRLICKHEGCKSYAINGFKVCTRHGAKKYKYICKREGCTNKVIRGGLCVKHGAKRLICKHEGCTNRRVNKGVCVKHGAIRPPRKKCEREGCNNIAQRLGVCCTHGAYR